MPFPLPLNSTSDYTLTLTPEEFKTAGPLEINNRLEIAKYGTRRGSFDTDLHHTFDGLVDWGENPSLSHVDHHTEVDMTMADVHKEPDVVTTQAKILQDEFSEILSLIYGNIEPYVRDEYTYWHGPDSKNVLLQVGGKLFPGIEVPFQPATPIHELRNVLRKMQRGLCKDSNSAETLVLALVVEGTLKFVKMFVCGIMGGARNNLIAGPPRTRPNKPLRIDTVQGHGKYKVKTFGDFVKGIGRELRPIARAAKSKLKTEVMGKINGAGLYHGSGRYTGSGSYTETELAAFDHPGFARNEPLVFRSAQNETDTVTISGVDYVGDLYASGVSGSGVFTPFERNDFSINAGSRRLFPRAFQIAANFEEFQMEQMIVTTKSTLLGNATNGTGQFGTVAIATQYNAGSQRFTDKQSMLEYSHSCGDSVVNNVHHGVECDPKKSNLNELFVRTGPVPAGQDMKTYDKGVMSIAVCDVPAIFNGLPIAEIYVYFRIRLRKMRMYVARGLSLACDKFLCYNGNTLNPFSTLSALNTCDQNSLGCALSVTSNTLTITFPDWWTGGARVLLHAHRTVAATDLVKLVNTRTLGGNVVPLYDYCGGTGLSSAGSYSADYPGATSTLTAGALYTGIALTDVFVRASSGGVDNTIQFLFTASSIGYGSAGLTITQYQTDGLANANERLTWKDASGNVVVLIGN